LKKQDPGTNWETLPASLEHKANELYGAVDDMYNTHNTNKRVYQGGFDESEIEPEHHEHFRAQISKDPEAEEEGPTKNPMINWEALPAHEEQKSHRIYGDVEDMHNTHSTNPRRTGGYEEGDTEPLEQPKQSRV